MLAIFRRWLRRPAEVVVGDAPLVSRVGLGGARAGSQRHRPSADEQRLAARLGVGVHDPEQRQI